LTKLPKLLTNIEKTLAIASITVIPFLIAYTHPLFTISRKSLFIINGIDKSFSGNILPIAAGLIVESDCEPTPGNTVTSSC
jgi:hypothetical protein